MSAGGGVHQLDEIGQEPVGRDDGHRIGCVRARRKGARRRRARQEFAPCHHRHLRTATGGMIAQEASARQGLRPRDRCTGRGHDVMGRLSRERARCRIRISASSSTCCASTASSSMSTGRRARRCRQGDEAELARAAGRRSCSTTTAPTFRSSAASIRPAQGAARVRGDRGRRVRQGPRRPRQPDRADARRRHGAVPRGGHHRRRHRPHAGFRSRNYSPKDGGPYITPGIVVSKDPGDRRSRHRPLPLSDPRQEHVLVFGAAVPPLRQEPREVPAAGHHAARARS